MLVSELDIGKEPKYLALSVIESQSCRGWCKKSACDWELCICLNKEMESSERITNQLL